MDGTAQMNPAHVILPAGTMMLAGMAWCIGWIDGNMVGTFLLALLAIVALFGATVVLSLPALIAMVLIWLVFSGLARHAKATP